jgi:hypothetical protein
MQATISYRTILSSEVKQMTEAKQQQAKALVLGGGGTTGIAWEMGILFQPKLAASRVACLLRASGVSGENNTQSPAVDYYAQTCHQVIKSAYCICA